MSVISTDPIGAVLENILSPEEVPDLFVFAKFDEVPMTERVKSIMKDPAELIDYVRKTCYIVSSVEVKKSNVNKVIE